MCTQMKGEDVIEKSKGIPFLASFPPEHCLQRPVPPNLCLHIKLAVNGEEKDTTPSKQMNFKKILLENPVPD